MNFQISPAARDDASAIAAAIIMAVGDEITESFAGGKARVPLVHEMFQRLASRSDSQYSYLNTLVARADNGVVAGVLICYDGAKLAALRRAFYQEAEQVLGITFEQDIPDEASADEIYLDSLAVFEPYRGHGLASQLIKAAARRYAECGKPLGLLVDPPNERAYKLYRKLGFVKVGSRPFADTMMDHLQLVSD